MKDKLKKIKNKKICILGYGLENQALVKFLLSKNLASEITICDKRTSVHFHANCQTTSLKWRLGKNYDNNLNQFDIIFRIAGYPMFSAEIKKAKKSGVEISSPIKLFFDLCPTKNIIGVTGSKGKGTTASLVYDILKTAFAKTNHGVYIGGNIGIPAFSFFNKIKTSDWVILELSSFQLEDPTKSPRLAVITNFYREHMASADPLNPNFHKSMADYWQAKANIFKYQKKGDYLIINHSLKNKTIKAKSKIISFNKLNLESNLIGDYNQENIGAAAAAAKVAGVKLSVIKSAVKNFKPLPHRLEFISEINGRRYYDNSFATTPESTISDLKNFNSPVVLLAGGADKGADFKKLAKIIKLKVKFLILFKGQATPKIRNELRKISYPKDKIKIAGNMKEAVKISRTNSARGDIILLSPACASFGLFKNYKERGELFKKETKKQSQ